MLGLPPKILAKAEQKISQLEEIVEKLNLKLAHPNIARETNSLSIRSLIEMKIAGKRGSQNGVCGGYAHYYKTRLERIHFPRKLHKRLDLPHFLLFLSPILAAMCNKAGTCLARTPSVGELDSQECGNLGIFDGHLIHSHDLIANIMNTRLTLPMSILQSSSKC